MADYEKAKQKLVQVLLPIIPTKQALLNNLKKEAADLFNHPDFIWHVLLSSMATQGNSRGWDGLIGDTRNYDTVSYYALVQFSQKEREEKLREALLKGKVRMQNRKAKWLASNYSLIERMGGTEASKKELLNLHGREKKIEFLKQFKGIGKKYSRNIMMDIYHEDFRNSIAIDARLKSIARHIDFTDKELSNYERMEQFYLDVAKACGIDGWELDRILYRSKDEIIARL